MQKVQALYLIKISLYVVLCFFISIYYIGNLRITWFFLDVSILFSFIYLISLKKIKLKKCLFISCLVLLILIIAIFLLEIKYFSLTTLLAIYYIIRPFVFMCFLLIILKKSLYQKSYNQLILIFLNRFYYILLLGFFISIPTIFWEYNKGFYMDNITGLMGKGATHMMGYTWLLLLSFLYFFRGNSYLTCFLYSIVMLILSTLSSIRVFIVYLILWWFIIILLKNYSFKKISIFLTTFFLFIFLFYKILMNFPYFSDMIDTYVYVYKILLNNITNSERLSLLLQSFKNQNSLFLGNGFGSYSKIFIFYGTLHNLAPAHLFMHQISPLIMECGILFTFIIMFLYAEFFLAMLFINKKNTYISSFFILYVIIFLFFFYAPFYSDPRAFFLISLNIFTVSFSLNNEGLSHE